MKFIIKRYFSGYCVNEIEAPDIEATYKMATNLPINQEEILNTLEEWKDCDEIAAA